MEAVVLIVLAIALVVVLHKASASRPRGSTGPEMDKVLMENYERDIRKYQRKVEGHNWEMQIAASRGINNPALRVPPKPPLRPRLSTDA